MQGAIDNKDDNYVGVWQMIPKNAFLYFPEGEEIKIGTGEKQWRKIFQGNQQYDTFEKQALEKLQQKLLLSNIQVHPWFDNANKLRYLQANKWKNTPTCQAIAQYSRYRASQFPIKQTQQILTMLSKGTFYICGRDHQYRPIIVTDISRLNEKDVDLIVPTLVFVMEFLINELLIEGQVENYVLLMNLESFQLSQRNIVSKIMSFTSKSYRGRLFVSYILGAPFMLRTGWNSFASAFVSENTLKKLKITGDLQHKDMWTHMDKQIIEKKYGGNCQNITQFWPPASQKLLYQSPIPRNKLKTIEEYNKLFQQMKLEKRKVLKHLLRRKTMTTRQLNKSLIVIEEKDPIRQSQKILESIDRQSLTDTTILIESTIFPQDLKFIHPFFKGQKYLKIK